MGIEFAFRKYMSRFSHFPGYHRAAQLYLSVSDKFNSYRQFGTTSPEGFYKVEYNLPTIDPTEIWITKGTMYNCRKLTGDYERPILEYLYEELQGDSTFWEIGAASGYFSLLSAQIADSVRAIDNDNEALSRLADAAERNGIDNIKVTSGTVGDGLDLNQFEQPDIALIDIEGWEYYALKESNLLNGNTKLIIEMHVDDGSGRFAHGEPEKLEDLLLKKGFQLREIFRRTPTNYHILAQKTLS